MKPMATRHRFMWLRQWLRHRGGRWPKAWEQHRSYWQTGRSITP